MLGRNTFKKLSECAQAGWQLRLTQPGETKANVIWKGLGNRSGLHDFANTLNAREWDKKGQKLQKLLASLPQGAVVEVMEYVNVNRDRGSWKLNMTRTVLDTHVDCYHIGTVDNRGTCEECHEYAWED